MDLRCIALDLDRTTLNAQGCLSEENRQALTEAIRSGVEIVPASGRAFTSLPPDICRIPGIRYAVTGNGAAVYDLSSGQCIMRRLMTPQSVEEILRLSAASPVVYEAFVDSQPYACVEYVRNPVAYGASPASVPYIQRTRRAVDSMVDFIRAHLHELDSIDLIVPSAQLQQELHTLLSQIPDLYITSSASYLLELSHKDCGKHTGLQYVLELLHILPQQTAAMGDGDNDADMLRYAGIGIAVANASPACLAAADIVTGHHDHDGVAQAIRMLLRDTEISSV